ncbi:Oxidoreductase FAD-binding domain protein [Thermocrinis albus DSM 14484]|uniref:Oxidoreductase FAD-binding domain protein n=1 Tax=Thermocrinis albus (strain DSM 14484 / JCM 11386 / HI 11/12) TaxID=638303 RepID=D3SMS6_THEAH|nr:ferredoxin reductase [Thermocrinis albus]ADC90056.1 Oxidoreductase FAD-binding domain protein [Thermocrinis albus DSM 14484]
MELEKKPIVELEAPVVDIITETPSTKTLVLDVRHQPIDFYPGQYVLLYVPYPPTGEILKRAYSIASSPLKKDFLELTVKRVPNGRASSFLTQMVKVGDVLRIKGPYGKFIWLPSMSEDIVLIGAGSGIVPLMCILRYIKDARLEKVKALLIYSNTSYEEIIYREELNKLSQLPNIRVVHTLTRQVPEGWTGYTGRINLEMLEKEVREPHGKLYYLCGPPAFVDYISGLLTEMGVRAENIKKEKYE